jgi:hypothetical protein
MWHWDGGWLMVYVLVHLPTLAEQAGTCKGCHLFSQERPAEAGGYQPLGCLDPWMMDGVERIGDHLSQLWQHQGAERPRRDIAKQLHVTNRLSNNQ